MELSWLAYIGLFAGLGLLVGVPAVIGVAIRRWWLTWVVLVVWVVLFALKASTGSITDGTDFNTFGALMAGVLLGLIPAELGATIGVAVGRALWPPRTRGGDPPPP